MVSNPAPPQEVVFMPAPDPTYSTPATNYVTNNQVPFNPTPSSQPDTSYNAPAMVQQPPSSYNAPAPSVVDQDNYGTPLAQPIGPVEVQQPPSSYNAPAPSPVIVQQPPPSYSTTTSAPVMVQQPPASYNAPAPAPIVVQQPPPSSYNAPAPTVIVQQPPPAYSTSTPAPIIVQQPPAPAPTIVEQPPPSYNTPAPVMVQQPPQTYNAPAPQVVMVPIQQPPSSYNAPAPMVMVQEELPPYTQEELPTYNFVQEQLPQYRPAPAPSQIFVTPPPIIIPPKTMPGYKGGRKRKRPTYKKPPTQAPKGFVSTLLPPLQSTTPPPYNSKPPISFSDMFVGNMVTNKPRTSYKNNAPAPTYVALSNDEAEEDKYGTPLGQPIGPEGNEPPMVIQGQETDEYGTPLAQPVSEVSNTFPLYDEISPSQADYDVLSPPVLEYEEEYPDYQDQVFPGITPRFNQDSSTPALFIPDTVETFGVGQNSQDNNELFGTLEQEGDKRKVNLEKGQQTSIVIKDPNVKIPMSVRIPKQQIFDEMIKGQKTNIFLKDPNSQVEETTQVTRNRLQITQGVKNKLKTTTFDKLVVNEASPPPDAQFASGYSAPFPEHNTPTVFSSSFVPDTTNYQAPQNNVIQTGTTYEQPIENDFIENDTDDYGAPGAPIITELPPASDTPRYQTINRNPPSTEQSQNNQVYNGHTGLTPDKMGNINIDINVFVNDDDKSAKVFSSSSQAERPLSNSHGPVSTTYRAPTSSNLPTTTNDAISDTTSYTTINRPSSSTNSRPASYNGPTSPSSSFSPVNEEYDSFTSDQNDDYGTPLGNVISASDEYTAPGNDDYGALNGNVISASDDYTAPGFDDYRAPLEGVVSASDEYSAPGNNDYGDPVGDAIGATDEYSGPIGNNKYVEEELNSINSFDSTSNYVNEVNTERQNQIYSSARTPTTGYKAPDEEYDHMIVQASTPRPARKRKKRPRNRKKKKFPRLYGSRLKQPNDFVAPDYNTDIFEDDFTAPDIGIDYKTPSVNSDYGVPVASDYRSPSANKYGASVHDDYGAPVHDDYGAPIQDDYSAPVPDDYGAPIHDDYGAPVIDDYHTQSFKSEAPGYDNYDNYNDAEYVLKSHIIEKYSHL